MVFPLTKLNKEGTLLNASHSYYTEEYAQRMCSLYLTDELSRDETGKIKRTYRLHASSDHTEEMAFAYEIHCPKCGNHLKQIGRQLTLNALCATEIKEEKNMISNTQITAQPEYDIQFWNAMRNKEAREDILAKGRDISTGTYSMPTVAAGKVMNEIEKESDFRKIATVIRAYKNGYRIFAKDCKDKAEFVAEGAAIPVYESAGDFDEKTIESYKLASIVTLDEDFVNDVGFDIEKYLTQKLGKSFGKAEDNAFINGTGADEPTGILHNTDGAETALAVETLTYDDVISLYFSVDKEYRKNGIWLMNDKTALALRKLKDNDGNYLWNQANDTILGKQVIISEYMPDVETGTKPIAFGDFSYYWIVGRKPVTVRTLLEKFVLYDQIGYLAFEFLDGKLVRNEAIKVIQMADAGK